MARDFSFDTLLNAISAPGHSNAFLVSDHRHKDLVFSTSGLGAGDSITVRVKGSFQETAPSFDQAASPDNEWTYIQTVDLEDGTAEDGAVGLSFSETDSVRALSVNADGVRWLCIEIVSNSDQVNSSVTCRLSRYN